MLKFIGVRQGMVALDVSAAGGYTTELIARAVGPSGRVYGQTRALDNSGGACWPNWSPDGRQIANVLLAKEPSTLQIRNADGSAASREPSSSLTAIRSAWKTRLAG